jgi:hypothetical protein
MHGSLDALADATGEATAELKGEILTEVRKEVEGLRSEVTMLRAQANMPTRRHKPAAAGAPFKTDDDAPLRN